MHRSFFFFKKKLLYYLKLFYLKPKTDQSSGVLCNLINSHLNDKSNKFIFKDYLFTQGVDLQKKRKKNPTKIK